MRTTGRIVLLFSLAWPLVHATNAAGQNKPGLPPAGIEVDADTLDGLARRVAELMTRAHKIQAGSEPAIAALVPDAVVFVKGVDYAVRGREFYSRRDVDSAKRQLDLAAERLDQLQAANTPWTQAQGLVVRGFRSTLDGSVQPIGLEIPEGHDFQLPTSLYVWLHGRGDKMLEVQFIEQRMSRPGPFRPQGAIVLHPFGRYCNGYKSAGEVDVLEAIAATARMYNIDPARVLLCGFSMGGAGAWHLGAHYTDRWAAVHAGAGFVDVRRYQNLRPEQFPAWYEQVLWNVYDVPSYARNFLNVPLVVYSGELDKQKQAADIMEEVLRGEGLTMTHVIGPKTPHRYEPAALKTVLGQLKEFQLAGKTAHPESVFLQTRTLRYPRMFWIELRGLDEHWRDSRVDATRTGTDQVEIATQNVRRLRLHSPWPVPPTVAVTATVDGQSIAIPPEQWKKGVNLERDQAGWRQGEPKPRELEKRPGRQGPIDDAFLEPFLVVTPTGKSDHPEIDRRLNEELARFRDRWRKLFRGEFFETTDREVSDEQRRDFHLILWGTPQSNRELARLAEHLPIAWDRQTIAAGDQRWPANEHYLAMIHPNPEVADRYVVLNSGITFREAHDRTNSLQNPKLPDWAIVNIQTPATDSAPGQIADAGFFDEYWKYKPRSADAAGVEP